MAHQTESHDVDCGAWCPFGPPGANPIFRLLATPAMAPPDPPKMVHFGGQIGSQPQIPRSRSRDPRGQIPGMGSKMTHFGTPFETSRDHGSRGTHPEGGVWDMAPVRGLGHPAGSAVCPTDLHLRSSVNMAPKMGHFGPISDPISDPILDPKSVPHFGPQNWCIFGHFGLGGVQASQMGDVRTHHLGPSRGGPHFGPVLDPIWGPFGPLFWAIWALFGPPPRPI